MRDSPDDINLLISFQDIVIQYVIENELSTFWGFPDQLANIYVYHNLSTWLREKQRISNTIHTTVSLFWVD